MTAIGVNAANISRYQWVIGTDTIPVEGATVTYSIPTVGIYNVTLVLTDINGCKTIVPKPNFLSINGPAANFTTAGGACYGKTFTFTDGSTPNPGIRDWIFDFGDGIKDTLHNAPFTHIYNQLGAFDVSLTVVDNAGCTDSYTLPSQILVTNPIAGFRADTFYCPQTPLQFVDTSSGVGLNYLWTFGDGNTSTLQNPENSYSNGDATYSVKLVITDLNGCQDSVSKNNYIRIASPKAAFEITDTTTICPPLRTGFIFQGKDYESWIWDFGDGGSSTVQSPSHFYSGFGHFIPTLTLFGPGGCTNTASATVSVYDPYSSRINYGPITRACNSLNVDFDITLPPGFKYYFSFGDGTLDSSGRTSFSHFYPRPSFNQPILFMTDTAQGCQAAVAGSPRIDVLGAIPLFGKDKEEFCDQGTVQFKDFTTKNEAIQSTLWTFGNAGTSTATDPSFNFTQPGLYEVTLEITTISNCTSSYKDTVLVYRTPAPTIISRDTICINVTEPFTAVLAQADTSINYLWTFGNGQTAKDSISNATFTTGGAFPVTLTATNKIGCTAGSNKSIYVAIPPTGKPVQNPITIISGGSAPLAMNYTGNIATYNWSPATGLNCVDCPIPTATPRFTTKYNLELSDVFGCRSSSEVTVNVVCNNLNYFVPNTFSPNGDGHNETFFARGTGLFSIKSFTVFNRWGQIVFEKKNMAVNDPGVGWNGTFNGQKASPDVYVYIIEILCDNGMVVPVKGNVTLLR
jgi:gliding motility-associated-like protein